jgi:ribulose-phosphate 3-epimerase
MEIVPAILPVSREDLEQKLVQLRAIPQVKAVQIDAVDGRFAAPACWPYITQESLGQLPRANELNIDADLMVSDPERQALEWARAGARRLTIHVESAANLDKVLEDIFEHTGALTPEVLSVGLALGIETPVSIIRSHLDRINYVQLMGIAKIGKQHQSFDARVLRKIQEVRTTYPNLTIQIDGGVSRDTAPKLIAAGADRLIVGSALWRAQDLATEFQALSALG